MAVFGGAVRRQGRGNDTYRDIMTKKSVAMTICAAVREMQVRSGRKVRLEMGPLSKCQGDAVVVRQR